MARFGLTLGLVYGLSVVAYSYFHGASQPGTYELMVQTVVVAACGGIGAALGTLFAVIARFLGKWK